MFDPNNISKGGIRYAGDRTYTRSLSPISSMHYFFAFAAIEISPKAPALSWPSLVTSLIKQSLRRL